ncbi:carbohydrate esterase family 16 protein [Aplosporella prunicola CBS 121167]|uniref:Carbohydrate esterase family 16 protein n=1 Tax=Aplosporella prunicola CBS 121167 TaxID=1176127 RepID=A0A6A6BM85_9PEZI|nr:carbohydrate esterase family 16 protein [Aplosporella prunicola CBS 121167]KAF2145232.1 carbohydrate esterase family 16 protein [Aplosporella prunicola CBS 121167]
MRVSTPGNSVLAALLPLAAALPPGGNRTSNNSWNLKNFKSLVAFGDSYTDEGRLSYFGTHNGTAPPAGWVEPVGNSTSTGGYIWPRYVADYTGANVYNYAVSGATCSNAIISRIWDGINAPFPDVAGYEVPAFLADKALPGFLELPADETVFSLWIGTNDIGSNAFLTDSQPAGLTLSDYLDCVYAQLDRLYAAGARFFVLMNLVPLQLSPLYALEANGGVGGYQNTTETSFRMWEQVVLTNDVYEYRTPYEFLLKKRYPGAHVALFDMYSLVNDMYAHPSAYFNGTAPLNVTGWINHDGATLPPQQRDSFLWYDSLHPSEQADRVFAREFVGVVAGESRWASYW